MFQWFKCQLKHNTLVRKFSLRIVSKSWQILFVLLNITGKISKHLVRGSGVDRIQKIPLEKS
ncbi:hypothetical protein A6769_25215 [Nostoc punctiforme NIES-2108]|uniref:Uncharacterized protein n=1 Tax=Nostoc punctiforme NIES-2108 TaxID=1356359 RepID=A0A367RC48_NOSPU|nr:hypothetical protein A6769_25215 [Nostoc punctiforme NIES-2108]